MNHQVECRRRVSERGPGQILHARVHRLALIAEKIIDLGEQPWK